MYCLITDRQQSWGKVMFSVMFVFLFTGVGVEGSHVTITDEALDLTSSHQMSALVLGGFPM